MGNINLKDAFSEALIQAAYHDKRIIVVDPEVARSTKMREFAMAHPDSFYEMGVAEQNSVGVAAGLASGGNIVFVVAFAPFAVMRPIEIIRTSVAYPKQNVKIVGQYAGFTDGKDGATHECLEDIGMMRTIPDMTIVSPSDAAMTRGLVHAAIAHEGPMYIRLDNESVPAIYPEDFRFEVRKAYKLKEGGDVTLAAYGTAVHRILEASKELEAQGIHAEVIDMATIKPIDRATLLASLRKTGRLVTLEDHNIHAGLASAIAEVVLGSGINPGFRAVAVREQFGISGSLEGIREFFGLTAHDVALAAKELMRERV
jgi:Transketolase, C-terminal subunit